MNSNDYINDDDYDEEFIDLSYIIYKETKTTILRDEMENILFNILLKEKQQQEEIEESTKTVKVKSL